MESPKRLLSSHGNVKCARTAVDDVDEIVVILSNVVIPEITGGGGYRYLGTDRGHP